MSRTFVVRPLSLLSILIGLSHAGGSFAAAIAPDRRGPLTERAGQAPFLMSALEIARVRNTTGFVHCPGSKSLGNHTASSGFLIGTATDTYVVTVAHAFIDAGGNPRQPLSACTFTSFGLRSERIPLLFNRKNGPTYAPWTTNWPKDPGNDFIIVRLSRPSPDAEPFSLNDPGMGLNGLDANRLFAVSALQDGYDAGGDPILQNCAVRREFPSHDGRPSVAYTDCSVRVGASGSVLLARVNGVLSPVAMVQGTSLGADGLGYDEATGNFSTVIGLNGRFIDRARELMGASFK